MTQDLLSLKEIDIHGQKIVYTDLGAGTPILFIHGFPENLQGWRKNIPELSKHFRCIALDVIGSGRSAQVETDFTCQGMANFIKQFLDALGIEKAHVIGTDTGASIALAFSAEYPENVLKLMILSGTAYKKSICAWEVNLMMMPILGDLGCSLIGHWILPYSVKRAFHKKEKLEKHILKEYIDCLSTFQARHLAVRLLCELERTAEEPLQKLKTKCPPTLILWSEHEIFFYPWVPKKLNEDLQGSRLEYIKDCGHFLQEEQPEIFNQKVLDFFND